MIFWSSFSKRLLKILLFQELYELYFVFACVWAFGSSLYHDGTVDHRAEFSKWFSSEFKNVTFPANGNVFDFFVDNAVQEMMPWINRVPKFELDPDVPLQVSGNPLMRSKFSQNFVNSSLPLMS